MATLSIYHAKELPTEGETYTWKRFIGSSNRANGTDTDRSLVFVAVRCAVQVGLTIERIGCAYAVRRKSFRSAGIVLGTEYLRLLRKWF